MNGNETLEMPGRLVTLHIALSPSYWLMGILCPVVQSLARTMFDAGPDFAFGRAIGSEFVGDHDAWRMSNHFSWEPLPGGRLSEPLDLFPAIMVCRTIDGVNE